MEEENKIVVVLVKPGEYAKIVEISDELESMQGVVGGYIEEYMPFDDDVAIICNEEGKLKGMEPNRSIYTKNNEGEERRSDIICGTFFVCYAPIESEKFLSMPEKLAWKYQQKFRYPEKFTRTKDGVVGVPYKYMNREKER